MNRQNKLVCLLEPDEAVRVALSAFLRQRGWDVVREGQAGELKAWLDTKSPVALISESRLPDMNAEEVLSICIANGIPAIFTGHGRDIDAAVNLMRKGASDFLEKPFNQQRLIDSLNSLTE